ncbi:MAG TPA: Gfo/Idh/MocA family oxidoreductase [Niastella sp.]
MRGLIVGLGSIAQKHIHALRAIRDDVSLFAIRSGHSTNNVEGVTNLILADVENSNLDFAIISNPTFQHTSALSQLLPLGIPLLIEKPLFHKIGNEELQLVKTVNEQGVLNYVGFNLRFHPCVRYFKEEILPALAVINEVNVYCGSYLPDWRPGRNFREIYSSRSDRGGGVHLDLTHELDYVYWFFGKPLSTSQHFHSKSDLKIDAVDQARYLWEYPNYCVNISLNYYRRTPKRQVEVLTDKGEYILDLIENKITFNGKVIVSYDIDRFYTYIKQMEYFTANVIAKQNMMNDVNEALEVLKLCLNDTAC